MLFDERAYVDSMHTDFDTKDFFRAIELKNSLKLIEFFLNTC